MSIEKEYQKYFIACDYCDATNGEYETFEDAVEAKEKLGWKSRKDADGDWVDLCIECQKTYK